MTSEPDADADADADADNGGLRSLLSALADGEAGAAESGRGCAAWGEDAGQAQQCWHAYQLIGDVLRSEDLASSPARDREFLDRLRQRLRDEPVVLAPAALAREGADKAAARRTGWAMPLALAAGVMALATVLVLRLGPAGGAGSSVPLAAAPAPMAVTVAGAAQPAPVLEPSGQGSRIVRDAQLDRYLRAHRDYGTALPGSLPGGAARSITTVSLDR